MGSLLANHVLVTALSAWVLAQLLKLPVGYLQKREWDWSLLFGAGGMPSSHAALIVSAAVSIGLTQGFDSPLFGLALAVALIVLYDAAGIRRQAGEHARLINAMLSDLASGNPLHEEQLIELLGHTPGEVFAGAVLGLAVAEILGLVWR
ncbi:MAG: divergent PAP2 family protein [Anaerolineales bacterium]|jgi:acid phosphatase family membrane protein YuiD